MTHPILKDADDRMAKTVEATREELSRIRTGKASPSLLDPVRVHAYGSTMPLNQVATVSTPDPRLITIQPWDKNLINEIEKAILTANLGFNPANDGNLIRVPIPALNEERRQEYVKICRKIAEDGKIAIRNIRRDANDHLKKLEKDHEISEDQSHTFIDDVQKITDKYSHGIDDILKMKENELMEVRAAKPLAANMHWFAESGDHSTAISLHLCLHPPPFHQADSAGADCVMRKMLILCATASSIQSERNTPPDCFCLRSSEQFAIMLETFFVQTVWKFVVTSKTSVLCTS